MTVPCLVVVALLLGLGPDYGFAAPAGTAEDRKLRVGAFNIQTFGRTKMSREVVAEQIKQVRCCSVSDYTGEVLFCV